MNQGHYEEFNPEFEYIDLSYRNLGPDGILEVLQDITGDQVLKQVSFNYNIIAEDFREPKQVEEFIKAFKRILSKHRSTLVAIDLAGSHLFRNHPHPTNEHTKNYQVTLCTALMATKITHIDLSDTNITGNRGRELMGLTHLMKNYMVNGKAFQCRMNKINSQGVWAISNALGPFSSLTFLDLSHNQAALDPTGRHNSEGIAALSTALRQSLYLRVLKIADNFLEDDDFVHLSEALGMMPQFQDLDVSSNQCRTNGARALKLAIISHSTFSDDSHGFRHIDISNNPLGEGGARELAEAIRKTFTIKSLKLRCCSINEAGIKHLHSALAINQSIKFLDIEGNDISAVSVYTALAEVQAANDVEALREDPNAVDANALTVYAYNALSRKLRFLTKPQLALLHHNPSFNIPESTMQEALHLLEPPPRHDLIEDVKHVNDKLSKRLTISEHSNRKLMAARLIYLYVMDWFEPIRVNFQIQKSIEAAAKRKALLNVRNTDDDRFK